jgi:CRISPR type III-B/RAMP module-associated protein Cmr5
MQNLDQLRAKHAWGRVEKIRIVPDDIKNDEKKVIKWKEDFNDYESHAQKLPARIITSGLGQALAFILAKGKKDKKTGVPLDIALLHDLAKWLTSENREYIPKGTIISNSTVIEFIHGDDCDSAKLRMITAEILEYMVWLNRFLEPHRDKGAKNE